MYKIKLILNYNGENFCGWESDEIILDSENMSGLMKKRKNSIKEEIIIAIYKLFNEYPLEIICAGRTDAGVHAIYQVCHFTINKLLDKRNVIMGLNSYLPNGIKIRDAEYVSLDFSARFSAKYRNYRYFLKDNALSINNFLYKKALCIREKLDFGKIDEVIKILLSQKDFSFFLPKKYEGRRIRNLDQLYYGTENFFGEDLFFFHFRAISFGYHQVRNMMSAVLKVGQKRWTIDEFKQRLSTNNRDFCGNMLSPYGLYLFHVDY